MWGICSLDSYDRHTKYKYLGRPQKMKLYPPHPGWQAELVKPMTVPTSLLRETICLGDFGISISAGTSVINKVHQPVRYCAPELFHDKDPSFASDMWSYMCLFAELYLDVRLFYPTGSPAVVSRMVEVLGPLPEHWKGDYKGAGTSDDSWYDQSRKPTQTLKSIFDRLRPEASQTERDHVLSIMSKGFCYLPESRLSAAELQQDLSFQAIMEIFSC
jgi:hypothetical protein